MCVRVPRTGAGGGAGGETGPGAASRRGGGRDRPQGLCCQSVPHAGEPATSRNLAQASCGRKALLPAATAGPVLHLGSMAPSGTLLQPEGDLIEVVLMSVNGPRRTR